MSAAPARTGAAVALGHRQVLTVFAGLMAGMLLAALDQTIVSTSLPTIVGDLGGLSHLSWVVSAYLLTSTAATPLFGKVSDLYGRKLLFQVAIITFLVGSALAGLSRNMAELIAFRALQGVGGGGLIAMTQVIVGDVVSPRERGRYMGYIGSTFAFASVAGPLLGGYFVDNLTWRWVFYINLPVGVVALLVTNSVLRLPFQRVRHPVDYGGAGLLVAVIASAVLVTSWGGTEFPWTSPVLLGLALTGLCLLVAFVFQERRAIEPILPLRLFANSIFTVAGVAGFLVGATMFGAIVFLPVFLQLVTGLSATNSGLLLLPLMGALVLSSVASGRLITITGRYRIFPVVGTAIMSLGIFLLSRMDATTSRTAASVYMAVLGLGIGAVMQVLVLAVQNSVSRRDLGIATTAASLFRSLGGAVGTAAFGAVLNNRLAYFMPRTVGDAASGLKLATVEGSPEALRRLPPEMRHGIVEAFAHSIHAVWLWALPVGLLAFVVVLFLRERPLRDVAHVSSHPAHEAGRTWERAAER